VAHVDVIAKCLHEQKACPTSDTPHSKDKKTADSSGNKAKIRFAQSATK